MKANVKRYMIEFGTAMAGYSVLVPISIHLLKSHQHSPVRYLFAIMPVIPAAFAMWAALRFFRGIDELQLRIQYEGLTFSFLGTCILSLTWGFLQNAGLPRADVIWVAPLLIVLWSLGNAMATRRYK